SSGCRREDSAAFFVVAAQTGRSAWPAPQIPRCARDKLKTQMPERILHLPLVPLRDMVVFPSMMAPFVVGRRASILALEATLATSEKRIFLATQKDPKIDDPSMDEIYPIGVIATVVQNLKLPNQNVKVMVEGLMRGEI